MLTSKALDLMMPEPASRDVQRDETARRLHEIRIDCMHGRRAQVFWKFLGFKSLEPSSKLPSNPKRDVMKLLSF